MVAKTVRLAALARSQHKFDSVFRIACGASCETGGRMADPPLRMRVKTATAPIGDRRAGFATGPTSVLVNIVLSGCALETSGDFRQSQLLGAK